MAGPGSVVMILREAPTAISSMAVTVAILRPGNEGNFYINNYSTRMSYLVVKKSHFFVPFVDNLTHFELKYDTPVRS